MKVKYVNMLISLFQHLMTSENSPIIEYYPLDFKTDLNGKQQEWEAVVLIPFIDEVNACRQTLEEKWCHSYQKEKPLLTVLTTCLCVFIQQRCLLAAMEPCNNNMTKEEKGRNCHTECAVYSYDKERDVPYTSSLPELFPDILHCHSR